MKLLIIYLCCMIWCLIEGSAGDSAKCRESEKSIQKTIRYGKKQYENRIKGGHMVRSGEYPFVAQFPNCAGVIIDQHHILTTATCAGGCNNGQRLGRKVYVGCHKLEHDCRVQQISDYVIHEDFICDSSDGFANDIALVKTKEAMRFELIGPGSVNAVAMPTDCLDCTLGSIAHIAGWGLNDNNRRSTDGLLAAPVVIEDNDRCKSKFDRVGVRLDTSKQICAVAKTGRESPCDMDQGGPLFQLNGDIYELLGIISSGDKSCSARVIPFVSTRVSYFMDWIDLAKHRMNSRGDF